MKEAAVNTGEGRAFFVVLKLLVAAGALMALASITIMIAAFAMA